MTYRRRYDLMYASELVGYIVTAKGIEIASSAMAADNSGDTYIGLAITTIGVGSAVMARLNRAKLQAIARSTQEMRTLGERAARQTRELADLVIQNIPPQK